MLGLKSLLQQGLSEPEFYGDLAYKFRKIYACNDFSTQFRKIILRYKKIGYNINVIRQTACIYLHAGGLGLRFCDGSSVKVYLKFNFG